MSESTLDIVGQRSYKDAFPNSCPMTKTEVERMVVGWLKATNFDVLAFLRLLKVVDYEETCQKVIGILLNASDEFLSEELSNNGLMTWNKSERA